MQEEFSLGELALFRANNAQVAIVGRMIGTDADGFAETLFRFGTLASESRIIMLSLDRDPHGHTGHIQGSAAIGTQRADAFHANRKVPNQWLFAIGNSVVAEFGTHDRLLGEAGNPGYGATGQVTAASPDKHATEA